jgi:hypothetical protein
MADKCDTATTQKGRGELWGWLGEVLCILHGTCRLLCNGDVSGGGTPACRLWAGGLFLVGLFDLEAQ